MPLKLIFSLIALALGIAGFYPYLRDTFQRKTQPHTFTWLIWAITQGVATIGLWVGGGGFGAISLTVGTALVILVFILSIRDGLKNITKSDIAVLIAAFVAIVLWAIFNQPVAAVAIVSAIDAIGYIPTFRKSFHDPWNETMGSWGLFTIGNIFSILALESLNFLTLGYIVTISIANTLLLLFLFWRRRQIAQSRQNSA